VGILANLGYNIADQHAIFSCWDTPTIRVAAAAAPAIEGQPDRRKVFEFSPWRLTLTLGV